MCGIWCKCRPNRQVENESIFDVDSTTLALIRGRGPDAVDRFRSGPVSMIGCTLWTQGAEPRKQPLRTEECALLYNGDLLVDPPPGCDSDVVCETLDARDPLAALRSLSRRGPFALVHWDERRRRLLFCRGPIGRRSLLVRLHEDGCVTIASALARSREPTYELPTGTIFALELDAWTVLEFPWFEKSNEPIRKRSVTEWFESLRHGPEEDESFPFVPSIVTEQDAALIESLKEIATDSRDQSSFLDGARRILRESVSQLIEVLSKSVERRVLTQPHRCRACVKLANKCTTHCTVGVLFSGGLDCTILAALADRHLPAEESIDLLNVSFKRGETGTYDTPDRITSRSSAEELRRLFPKRSWNLVEIDVTEEELRAEQRAVVADLIHPLRTVLDESLGSALWFAARGKTAAYTSTCRILLTGMGADELFGGYARHRNEFRRRGWTGLERELRADWRRIGRRNLARDDRVASHHGRQPRMPYLDEDLVDFALGLKPWQKCFPDDVCERGAGEKMLLRSAALELGLHEAAALPKRAIQFGSRIASKKENAKDVSRWLALDSGTSHALCREINV